MFPPSPRVALSFHGGNVKRITRNNKINKLEIGNPIMHVLAQKNDLYMVTY